MHTLALVIVALVGLLSGMVAAALIGNRPPLTDPPGLLPRLTEYLTRNVAETGPDARFPELGPVFVHGDAPSLLDAIAAACRGLGWDEVNVDAQARRVRATVVSSLFRFRDDVFVELLPRDGGEFEARIRSSSRVGRGDLAANARHVLDLRERLQAAGIVASAVAR